ncbi:dystonin-like isoform X3 [Littorina saxatilis]|uniref:dystonin-like isoform X3 n=1 Tax=Littorina saxatilis TaxID=31220 RepID=UPI0038B4FB0E
MVLTTALVFFYFRDIANYLLDWGEIQYKRKMARNEVKKCMEWLFQQQGEMEANGFGTGRQGVLEALQAQKNKAGDIRSFRSKMDKTMASEKLSEEAKKDLDTNFNSVSALSKKRQQCLDTVSQIAAMEDLVQGLSMEVDSRAVHLVHTAEAKREQNGPSSPQSNESMARASQTCVQAVRTNWQWMSQVMQCAEVHLRNAASYHEFFHEVEEAEFWMDNTLSRIHMSFDRSKLEGNRTDAMAIQNEIKDVLAAFLQWQTKIDYLFDKAKQVVPVPFRTTPRPEEKPVLALTDFSNSQITFIEGEALYLMDNTDRMKWKVRNNAGQVGVVPAVIILIPGPYGGATDAAIRLRLQLLSLWTASVKRLGYQLIAFMLLVFRDWNEDEVNLLQQMSRRDKQELLRVLDYIETTLQQNWHEYGDFQELQERIHRLRMIIEEAPEGDESNSQFLDQVVVQVKTLEDLLKKYKDFWTFWETYKTIVELIKQPEFLLVCDKWEQLRYITTAHFVSKFRDLFWDTSLDVADGDMTKQTASLALHETPGDSMVSSEITVEEETEETSTETVSTSLTEEQHTFIIKGVLDPRDNISTLDLQNAIMLGIVDQGKGLYNNPLTGESMTMQEAMNEGKVLMDFISKKKIREEKKSYGLITLKITRETRPYTITGVVDPVSEKTLTVTEATHGGILDGHSTTYKTETGEHISIHDAIASGLVHVEYHEDPNAKPEIVTKTYAVHGVVDQRRKDKQISFSEAVSLGLLDRDTGEYVNNVTHQKVGVQEAIMRGFIKARIITDPSKIEIDPRNQIVVEKMESAKQKVMRGVRAMKMFKGAKA